MKSISENWQMFYGVEDGFAGEKWHIVDESLQSGIYESLCGHSETASFPQRFTPMGTHPVCTLCLDKALQTSANKNGELVRRLFEENQQLVRNLDTAKNWIERVMRGFPFLLDADLRLAKKLGISISQKQKARKKE